jgi:nucleotide-binding universal stress UspA family protein
MMRILVPVDGSEYSNRALDVAVDLARALGAEVVIANVVDLTRAAVMSGGQAQLVGGALEELQDDGKRLVGEARARVAGKAATTTRVVEGSPIDEIEKLAVQLKASYIVMGTHGRSGLNRAVMGSVAEGVARRAPVPVMIVPPERSDYQVRMPGAR